ncbi:MAG TPA: sulfotransferase [Caulobacteraceae bacterium]|jgi:Flp pilus assembly protein TadD
MTPNPPTVEQLLAQGDRLSRQGDLAGAADCYRQALAVRPDHAQAVYNLGVVLRDQGYWTEASAAFEQAIALRPAFAEAHNNLGACRQRAGDFAAAEASYARSTTLKPDHAGAHYNLGAVLQFRGRFDAAQAAYLRALDLKPDHARAWYNLVQQNPLDDGSPEAVAAFGRLRRLSDQSDRLSPKDGSLVLFAMAAVLEARGDFEGAFSHLARANAWHRSSLSFDIAQTERWMEAIAGMFDRSLIERVGPAGPPDQTPIFIIGMPRSGTTLVEQIVSAHPHVEGGGEIANLARVVAAVRGANASAFPDWAPQLSPAHCAELGEAYLAGLPPRSPGQTRLTDKTLLNIEYVGLIHLCLPGARIISCLRDPRDVCLSCFASRFSEGHDYAYDLAELGRYWRAYDRLMDHWRKVLPAGRLFEIPYEALVGDVDAWSRRLIAHCGLDWDDACLRFHDSGREVRTASFAQVRRPIYQSAVGRWRRFAPHLGALLDELGDPWSIPQGEHGVPS